MKEQELQNRLREKDYGPAIALAFELKRPQRLWTVFWDTMTTGLGEGNGGNDGTSVWDMFAVGRVKDLECRRLEYCSDGGFHCNYQS